MLNEDVLLVLSDEGTALLHTSAVAAARAAKFMPAVVDGKPVKVSGVISYDFILK